jgi:hypothetical protein
MQPQERLDFADAGSTLPPLDVAFDIPAGDPVAHSLANSAWCCPALLGTLLAAADALPAAEREVGALIDAAAPACPEALLVGFCAVPPQPAAGEGSLHRIVASLVQRLGPQLLLAPRSSGASMAVLRSLAARNLPALRLLLQHTHEVDSSSTSHILNAVQVRLLPVRMHNVVPVCVEGDSRFMSLDCMSSWQAAAMPTALSRPLVAPAAATSPCKRDMLATAQQAQRSC